MKLKKKKDSRGGTIPENSSVFQVTVIIKEKKILNIYIWVAEHLAYYDRQQRTFWAGLSQVFIHLVYPYTTMLQQ